MLLAEMIVIKLLTDKFEDLRHELHLVQLVCGQKDNNELDEAVNESVVKSVVIESSMTKLVVLSQFNGLFYHNLAEHEQ